MDGGEIASPRNPRVAAAARLQRSKARREAGRSLLEGPHLLAEAVAAAIAVESVFALADDEAAHRLAAEAAAELLVVGDAALGRLAPTEHPRGPVAVFRIPAPAGLGTRPVVALWGVGDPGNAGTLVRTAAAFGVDVAAGPACVDLWSPKVLRAAAGGHFRTAVGVAGSVAGLQAAGFRVLATVVSGGEPPKPRSDGRWALLVGEEAHGLAPEAIAAADEHLTIPMPGATESLNAAVAGAITLYELTRNAAWPDS